MKYLFIILCLTCLFKSNAQSILTPSTKAFEKKWIKNDHYQTSWYLIKDTAKIKMATIVSNIQIHSDTLTYITEIKMNKAKGPWIDSSVALLKTLSPVYHSSYNAQRDMTLNFGKIVTGFYNDKAKNSEITISDTTATKYFDSNIYPYLLGLLPLKNGYKQEISIYDYNPAKSIGVMKVYIRDTKSGIYESKNSGSRNVWILDVTDDIAHANMKFFFDKEDRRPWKQEIELGGQKMLMVLDED